ncbi:TonB-dependent receptor domain-containing protein [Novosphingobium rosa]|uniref:TonB-dependent receptor domain-containing protein n=1 Tax=Novosphingobium rosa TaxID=76978 RepID=UPI00083108AE|nr:TonB-dependent receptor [Novosphingobium rosa]
MNTRRSGVWPVLACSMVTASGCLAGAVGALAQTPVPLDLPAQPLGQALSRLADLERVQILFDPSLTQGQRSIPLKGGYPVEAALGRMLAGTDLEWLRIRNDTILIRRRPAPPPVARRSSPMNPQPAPVPAIDPPPGDIIVTAARYRQQLQKVSATVRVVPGGLIAAQAMSSVSQILDAMPGVSTSGQPGGYSINIRGLGADMPSGTTQGSVALEFDGVYSIIALGTTTGFFDIDRVEVIKGPQSTRYGPNAEGGVVNVIAHDPQLGDRSGSASLSVGRAAMARIEVAQTLPLGDHAALRLAASAERRDSWFHPALANLRNQSLRARLLVQPQDRLTVRLTYQIDHIGGTGTGSEGGYPVMIDKVAPYAGDSINRGRDPWAQGDRATGSYDPARNHADLYQQTMMGNASLGLGSRARLDLTAAHLAISGAQTSCVHSQTPWAVSGEGSCYGVHEYAPFRQTSTELRLHSAEGAALQWTIGHYFWQFSKTSWSEAGQAVVGPGGGAHVGTRTQALFTEATVPVLPRLRLIVGGRQSWDHRVLRPSAIATTYTRDFTHTDFRFGEEVDLGRNMLHYITVASGYRPGGLAYDGNTATARAFASETTTAYETGIKGQLLDHQLTFDLAAFYYRQSQYQDIQNYNGFTVTLPGGTAYLCTGSSGQPAACALPSFNIASAYNIGLEWQTQLHMTRADTLSISGAFTRARFGSHLGSCATVAAPTTPGCWIGYNDQLTGALRFFRLDGTTQPHSPSFTTTIALEHRLIDRAGLQLMLRGQAYHSSSYWVGPVQDAGLLGFQPAYWQEGLSAQLKLPQDGLTLTVWLRNLTNYAVKMSTLPAVTIGEPRNLGLTAMMAW